MEGKPYNFKSFHEGFERARKAMHTVVGTVSFKGDEENVWRFYPSGRAERVEEGGE